MKSMWIFSGVLASLLIYQVYDNWIQKQRAKCLFYREGVCITCESQEPWPVGYKENCICENRTAYYVDEGLFPAWQCIVDTPNEEEKETEKELPPVSISKISCPPHHPLRDVLGNCYACDTKQPIRIAHVGKGLACDSLRYTLPDLLLNKSVRCPSLSEIQDPYVCVACGGVVWDGKCFNEGENRFCRNNENCASDEWCFPLHLVKDKEGICTKRSTHRWFCSATDGYNFKMSQDVCERQEMHIPTIEEIETADEDLSTLCPTLDMWTFFTPDGVVWLESFTQEFLFTREGESGKLGGHTFHALCHKD